MDKQTALARLKAMVAYDSAPTLSVDELDTLLTMYKTVDSAGLAPTEDDYVETWDLNRAAAEGWRWKAGKMAAAYDFQADGASYNRSQIVAMCEKMAAQYARKSAGSIPVFAAIAAAYPDEDDDE